MIIIISIKKWKQTKKIIRNWKISSASDNTKYQFQIQKNSGFQQYTSTIQSSDEKHSSMMTV